MEGPTLQQDVGAVLGFATSVVVVTGLWISFVRPVANAYQKIAKNIYSLLSNSGVVPEDNAHDTTRTVFPSAKKSLTAVSSLADAIKTPKVVSAVNGAPSAAPSPRPANGNTASGSAPQGRASPTVASNTNATQNQNRRGSNTNSGGSSARTSPKPGLSA
jgi:hypothetical protein